MKGEGEPFLMLSKYHCFQGTMNLREHLSQYIHLRMNKIETSLEI